MAITINEGVDTIVKTTDDSGNIQHVRNDGGTVGVITTVGALPDLPGGTVDLVTGVTTVTNLTSGSVRMTVGTVTVLPDLPGGTIDSVTAIAGLPDLPGGTVDVIAAGTVDTVGIVHADKWSAVESSGTSVLGTIKPAVSGSVIFVTDLVISALAATDVEIGSGGTSTPILGTVSFAANGGMVSNFRTPLFTASGSALVYKQSADTGLTITANGYVD